LGSGTQKKDMTTKNLGFSEKTIGNAAFAYEMMSAGVARVCAFPVEEWNREVAEVIYF